MKTDLVLAPAGATLGELLEAARAADAGGFDTVWTYDHFSGLIHDAGWSRDPFVTLGAIAATTTNVNVGPLVANAANRHPAQLACAVNSLQSLAPGRVLLGVGAGSGRRSRYASEHAAIGRPLADLATRRMVLADTIDALRALWRGEAFDGERLRVAAAMAVTDGAATPPIIVGAGARETIAIACDRADGVNVLPGPDIAERLAFAAERRRSEAFELSVFAAFDPDHELGGETLWLESLGVGRRTLWVSSPFPLDAIGRVGKQLLRG